MPRLPPSLSRHLWFLLRPLWLAQSMAVVQRERSVLAESEWRRREAAHHERVDAWILPHLERRARGVAHPVEDFLFTYYSYRPSALRRWHPGLEVALAGDVSDFAARTAYAVRAGRARVDPAYAERHRDRVRWIRDLLAATASRPAALGCFGLHEWAMVYRQNQSERRHTSYRLRLGSTRTDEVVESSRITCTHYDAFRFFTQPARPLNLLEPTRDRQPELDQPGCLHAAMDCYKWAYKLAPLTSSELVADCFELAREVRQVDMQASPYDLRSLGVDPIPIETPVGKAVYVEHQRDFALRSNVLRERLLAVCEAALSDAASHTPRTP